MDPAEELFDLKNDPYEMVNLVTEESVQEVLEKMRSYYDSEIEKWRNEAVPTGHYKEFAILFDRHVPWAEKKDLIPDQFWKVYARELEHTGYSGSPENYKEFLNFFEN